MSIHIAVISSGRPERVAPMQELLDGLPACWYVGAGEAAAYEAAGAEAVEAGALVPARNLALDEAARRGEVCVQLSDDLMGLRWADGPRWSDCRVLTLGAALDHVRGAMLSTRAQLGGVAPTDNPYFSRRTLNLAGFVVGDFCVIAAGCPLRFDPNLRLKEDYDYTCQHLARYGRVARCDRVLARFAHRSNPGGAVAYRTPQLEQETIAYLLGRWPQALTRNSRRPGELLLRWPKRAAA